MIFDEAGFAKCVVLHRTTRRTLYSRGTAVVITVTQLLLEPSESKSSERSSHGLTAYPVDSIGYQPYLLQSLVWYCIYLYE